MAPHLHLHTCRRTPAVAALHPHPLTRPHAGVEREVGLMDLIPYKDEKYGHKYYYQARACSAARHCTRM